MLYILIPIVLFLLVLIVRALAFKPAAEVPRDTTAVDVDTDRAVEHLAEMIRCKTVSYQDKALEDPAEFDKFEALLPRLYPTLHEKAEFMKLGPRSLLFRIPGRTDGEPTILMAHYDVVPVIEEGWEKPPFAGIVEDGVLWGRGTLDTKGTLCSILEAAEDLLSEGFVPRADLYLAFSGEEETGNAGCITIVDYFADRGIVPAMVLDEGGAVVEGVFPGVHAPAALIGTGEKGMMNVRLVLDTNGGHASTPPPHSPVGRLARAVANIENHPFPFELSRPAAELFDTLGRHSTFLYRLIFANLWCFKPVLNLICKSGGGELNALVRTTVAFTRMEGSEAFNVLPPHAWVGANLRLNGSETVESARARLEKLAADPDIRLEFEGTNPSRISVTQGEGWDSLKTAIVSTWTDAIVSPYLMLACSDSRHYGRISDKVYRFSAMALSKAERAMIHGHNERIPAATLKTTVEFYKRLIVKR